MASIYSCSDCGSNLNLKTTHLYPADFFFEAGNKGTLSFALIDDTKFSFEKEDKVRPFFETRNYWGIQRNRTKIKCNSCGFHLGFIYDDGPPLTERPGRAFPFGTSQAIPRAPRYRFKTKALRISSETWTICYSVLFCSVLYFRWGFLCRYACFNLYNGILISISFYLCIQFLEIEFIS